MIIESKKYQKLIKKAVIVLFDILCVLFCIVTAISYMYVEDKRVFGVFLAVTGVFSVSWILVYKFYVSKI